MTRLMPAQWLRPCPDCGRPLSVPADRHHACQQARRLVRAAWTYCPECGALNGRHVTTCTRMENPR
jgi:hypothetical protein